MTKTDLHRLIEELPESEQDTAFRILECLKDEKRSGMARALAQEIEDQVLGERRLRTLRELLLQASSEEECARLVLGAIERNPQDIPFALLFLWDGTASIYPKCVAWAPTCGEALPMAAMERAREAGEWSMHTLLSWSEGRPICIPSNLAEGLPDGGWPEPPRSAWACSIFQAGQSKVIGKLLLGISPRRAFDEDYQQFLNRVQEHVDTALARARAVEEALCEGLDAGG